MRFLQEFAITDLQTDRDEKQEAAKGVQNKGKGKREKAPEENPAQCLPETQLLLGNGMTLTEGIQVKP